MTMSWHRMEIDVGKMQMINIATHSVRVSEHSNINKKHREKENERQ